MEVSVDTNERLPESDTNDEGVKIPVKVGGKGDAVPPPLFVGVLPIPPPRGVPVNRGGEGDEVEVGLPAPPIAEGVPPPPTTTAAAPPEVSEDVGEGKEVRESVEIDVREGVLEALAAVLVG